MKDKAIEHLKAAVEAIKTLSPESGFDPGPDASPSERAYQALVACYEALNWLGVTSDGL